MYAIKKRILERVPLPGPIIDPYCGTGRMLMTLRHSGYDVVGVDCSPIAILAARVVHQKTPEKQLWQDFCALGNCISKTQLRFDLGDDEAFWFHADAFIHLRNILHFADTIANSNNVRRVFWLALAKAVREVSYVRDEEYKLHRMNSTLRSQHRPNAPTSFITHCKELIVLLKTTTNRVGRYRFLKGDIAKTSLKKNLFGAVVTSPPYGDSASTVGYGQYSRVPLLLLRHSKLFRKEYGCYTGVGLDGQCLGGATCVQPRLDIELPSSLPKGVSIPMERFAIGHFSRLALVSKLLQTNATCCLVLGNRTHRGRTYPLIEMTIEFLADLGFSLADRHDRFLSRKRLPRSMRHRSRGESAIHDSINYETVITMVR